MKPTKTVSLIYTLCIALGISYTMLEKHVIQLLHTDHITCSIVITCITTLVTVITQHSFSQSPSSVEKMGSFPNFLSSLFSVRTDLKVIEVNNLWHAFMMEEIDTEPRNTIFKINPSN